MIHAFEWAFGRQIGSWAAGLAMAAVAFYALKFAAGRAMRRLRRRP